jgi:hypothetical protein
MYREHPHILGSVSSNLSSKLSIFGPCSVPTGVQGLKLSLDRRRTSWLKSFRTVQKLAHRRQFEELSREGSEDGDGDRDEGHGNGHSRKRRGSSTDSDENEEPSPLGTRSRYNAMPVVLVQSTSKDTTDPKTPDSQRGSNGKDQMGVILVNPPTPTSSSTSTPSRSRSEQTLHDGNGQHGQHEDGQEGKGKQVKEGAYLKSKLWWFGLLLIATGEGGEFCCQRQCSFIFLKEMSGAETSVQQVTSCRMGSHRLVW